MKTIKNIIALSVLLVTVVSCGDTENQYDATGAFEADETIISAEVSGILREFKVEDGTQLASGEYMGYIDTTQLNLTRKQLYAQIDAVLSKKPNVNAQLAALKEQLSAAIIEKERIDNLLASDAATPKQLDDIEAQIKIIKGNIRAMRTSLTDNTRSLDREIVPLQAQIAQIDDQIKKSKIVNPVKGTVLMTYAERYEQVSKGSPLYKIADLSEIVLRAYVTGNQLPKIKLDQQVKVLTDDGDGGYLETTGTIFWISDKSEFTPKTVQTKDERANKVYAIKVRVKNDGTYKIGMYGEVVL